MNIFHCRLRILCCALFLALAAAPPAFAGKLYRYTDERGHVVINDRIPPEYASKGYEVLNKKGQVVNVVPPQLTEAQLAEAKAEEVQRQQAEADAQRQRERDESLLLRYSSVDDIKATRDRELSELQVRVNILKSNKLSLKQQVENYQAEAAEMERMGKEVGAEHLEVIRNLQDEIVSTDRAISDRLKEIGAVEAGYQADIDRFEELAQMVEKRHAMPDR